MVKSFVTQNDRHPKDGNTLRELASLLGVDLNLLVALISNFGLECTIDGIDLKGARSNKSPAGILLSCKIPGQISSHLAL